MDFEETVGDGMILAVITIGLYYRKHPVNHVLTFSKL
jgi:hypothetical protein